MRMKVVDQGWELGIGWIVDFDGSDYLFFEKTY
jgi:hypothetical protein